MSFYFESIESLFEHEFFKLYLLLRDIASCSLHRLLGGGGRCSRTFCLCLNFWSRLFKIQIFFFKVILQAYFFQLNKFAHKFIIFTTFFFKKKLFFTKSITNIIKLAQNDVIIFINEDYSKI